MTVSRDVSACCLLPSSAIVLGEPIAGTSLSLTLWKWSRRRCGVMTNTFVRGLSADRDCGYAKEYIILCCTGASSSYQSCSLSLPRGLTSFAPATWLLASVQVFCPRTLRDHGIKGRPRRSGAGSTCLLCIRPISPRPSGDANRAEFPSGQHPCLLRQARRRCARLHLRLMPRQEAGRLAP